MSIFLFMKYRKAKCFFHANILFPAGYPPLAYRMAVANSTHLSAFFHGRCSVLFDRDPLARVFPYQHVFLRWLLLCWHLSDQSDMPLERLFHSLGAWCHIHHNFRILVRRGCKSVSSIKCLGLQWAAAQSARPSLSALHHDLVFAVHTRRLLVFTVSSPVPRGIFSKILIYHKQSPVLP